MATVLDAGQYITELVPNVDKMKLYKLCYFAQGWNLAWTGRRLFPEDFQAWTYGPVPVELRNCTDPIANGNTIPFVPGGDSSELTVAEKRTIESIVDFYGKSRSFQLSFESHGLAWHEARGGLPNESRSSDVLQTATIRREFIEYLRSSEENPVAPRENLFPEHVTLEEGLSLADQVKETWKDSLALLATR